MTCIFIGLILFSQSLVAEDLSTKVGESGKSWYVCFATDYDLNFRGDDYKKYGGRPARSMEEAAANTMDRCREKSEIPKRCRLSSCQGPSNSPILEGTLNVYPEKEQL